MYGSKNNVQDKATKPAGRPTLDDEARLCQKDAVAAPFASDSVINRPAMNEQDTILSDYFSSLLGPAKEQPLKSSPKEVEEVSSSALADNEVAGSTPESDLDNMACEYTYFNTSIAPNRLLSIPLRPEAIPFFPGYLTAVRALQCLFELLGYLRIELPLMVRNRFLERCDEMMMLFRFSRHYKTMRVPHER
jgi:hypothetical protein